MKILMMLTAIFNTFRSLFRATDTSDVFSFDKDGCHSSKLSASLEFFFRGYSLRTFECILLHPLTLLIIFEICTCRDHRIWFERLPYILLIGRGHRET